MIISLKRLFALPCYTWLMLVLMLTVRKYVLVAVSEYVLVSVPKYVLAPVSEYVLVPVSEYDPNTYPNSRTRSWVCVRVLWVRIRHRYGYGCGYSANTLRPGCTLGYEQPIPF